MQVGPGSNERRQLAPFPSSWTSWKVFDEFTAYGTAATVQEQLDQWDATVDITIVAIPPGLPWPQIEANVRAGAPH